MYWLALAAVLVGGLISSPSAQTTDPAIAPAPPPVPSPTPTVPAVAPQENPPAAVEPTAVPPVQSERAEAERQTMAPFIPAEPLPPVQPAPPQPRPDPLRISAQPSRPAANEPMVTIGRPDGRANFGDEGNRRAAQLRSMPPNSFTFDRATLRDVMRFLADDAGIPYVGIPEHSPQAQRLVTFRMTASPFTALESVARQNDIKLMYEDGVWFMRLNDQNLERTLKKEDANELVGVIYQLKFDPGDRVAFESNGAYQGGPGGSGNSQTGGSSQAVVSGGAGGNGQNSPSSPQLPLQNSQYVFTARAPKIVNDIRVMLGLKPLIYGTDGSVEDPEAMAGAQTQQAALPGSDGSRLSPDASARGLSAGSVGMAAAGQESGTGALFPVYVPPQKPQVIYNGDNNVIWVVATRKQHKWVAEYLSKVDKPQDLIAIEVKFVETKKNPQTDIGINWQNTLGSGITVRGGANAGVGGEYKFGFDREKNWGSTNFSSSSGGNSILGAISNAVMNNQTNLTVDQILNSAAVAARSGGSFSTNFSGSGSRTANIDFRGQSTTVPYEAVLSLDEVSVTLQAFMQDRDSSVVQYPRVLTINNREVAITSAENTPVNAGVTQTQSGSTATQTGTLGYLPIGTQINILPKVVGRKQIALTVAVTISSIVGTVPINLGTGFNEYPITTERVYNATLQVDSGYTLAVGGLEKVDDRDTQGGVPVLKDIPGVGYFFKNKSKARNRTNLIIFMTPYIISDPARTPGISETPESIVPQRPGGPPQAPTFSPDGRLSGGAPAIEEAFAWLEYQLRYYRQVNEENLTNLSSVEKLQGVISVARVLLADLQLSAGNPPYTMGNPGGERVLRAETFLTDLNRTLAAAQENLM